ncbi:uncharacterized protein [Miscanthus floridulus]|uniref:uncharacterized protein n=1 Tax=Miscanthus floridulus TaxID=154761 RepID=UPI003458943C
MKNKIQRITGIMKQWLAFMSKMFSEMDCINEIESALHDEVGHIEMDDDDTEHTCSDDDGHGAYSNNDIGIDPEDSNENVYSPTNDVRPNSPEESIANAYSPTNDVQRDGSI